jgi:hypothetical protein
MSIFRKHQPTPYQDSGIESLKTEFILQANKFLDNYGILNPQISTVEEVVWDNSDILTSYQLRRAIKGKELDPSFVDGVEFTVTENYPDGQQSIKEYVIVPFYNGWTTKHIKQTKEKRAEAQAQFAAIPQPEKGAKVLLNIESNPAQEMEMLIHAVVSGMDKHSSS